MSHFVIALLMTMIAGLSTLIGWLISIMPIASGGRGEGSRKKFLAFSLGLSAGVMVYISFMELMPSALGLISSLYGDGSKTAEIIVAVAFFGGVGLCALIDRLVPSEENPHEIAHDRRLKKVGVATAIAITVHNFPEGIATFVTSFQDSSLAIAIAAAIAIHNIPEGIAVSVPVYQATGSRKKAFAYTLISGLAEPVGAVLAFAVLMPFISPLLLACTCAAVGGIMVFISFDELLPASHEFGEHHTSILGLVAGMAVMAFSLILL